MIRQVSSRQTRSGRARATGAVVACVLALVATACEGDPDPVDLPAKSEPGIFVIMADRAMAGRIEPFARKFGEANALTVSLRTTDDDVKDGVLASARNGSGPDIFVGRHDWIGELVRAGAIDPVPLTAAQKRGFEPTAIRAVTFEGQTYAMPYGIDNLMLFRNLDLAPDVPKSIEDVVDAGRLLKQAGKVQEILSLPVGDTGSLEHAYPLFTSAGGYVFGTKPNGEPDPADVGLDTPGSVAAFGRFAQLGANGVGALSERVDPQNFGAQFTTKKTAFVVAGPWMVSATKNFTPIKLGITPVPGFAGGKRTTPWVFVPSVFLASKGKNRDLARKFLVDHLSQTDLPVSLAQMQGIPPALMAAQTPIYAKDPELRQIVAVGRRGVLAPNIPEMAYVWQPFGEAEVAVVNGADVLTTATKAAGRIRDRVK